MSLRQRVNRVAVFLFRRRHLCPFSSRAFPSAAIPLRTSDDGRGQGMNHELCGRHTSGLLILGLLTVGCGSAAPETGSPTSEAPRPGHDSRQLVEFQETPPDNSLLHRTRDSLAEVTVDLTFAQERHETLRREIAVLEQRREQLRPISSVTAVPEAAADRTTPGRPGHSARQPHPASSATQPPFDAANASTAAWQDHDITLPMQARVRRQSPLHSASATIPAPGWSRAQRISPTPAAAVQRMPAGAVVIPLAHGVLIGIPEAAVPQPDLQHTQSGLSGH